MQWSGAERKLFKRIMPVVQDRLSNVNNDELERPVRSPTSPVKIQILMLSSSIAFNS